MPGLLDRICPAEVGAEMLVLARTTTDEAKAFEAIDITVAFKAAEKDAKARGLVCPIEVSVTSPSGVDRYVHRRLPPTTISFTPREGGDHLVLVRELAHNRWWGALVVPVAGERISP